MAITLPSEYGYVLLAATSTFFVHTYHVSLTSKWRKASGTKYPLTYAPTEVAEKDPKAFKFNCAQRSHANFTENLAPTLTAVMIAGLRFPVFAAAAGAGWSLLRALYAGGYTASGPSGRTKFSIPASLVDVSVKLTAIYAAVMFVLEQ